MPTIGELSKYHIPGIVVERMRPDSEGEGLDLPVIGMGDMQNGGIMVEEFTRFWLLSLPES